MMSNELPDLRDSSGAMAQRYLVLTLKKSWIGKEDISLFSRLTKELSGILIWALQGLIRLTTRGYFLTPTSSKQTIEELEAMTSPIKAFISEKCEIRTLASISVADLFDAWRHWCNITGYQNAGSVQSFGKNLRAALPELQMDRPQKEHCRERCYLGIKLA